MTRSTQATRFAALLSVILIWWAFWSFVLYTMIAPGVEFAGLIAGVVGTILSGAVAGLLLLLHLAVSTLWEVCRD